MQVINIKFLKYAKKILKSIIIFIIAISAHDKGKISIIKDIFIFIN